MPPVSVTQLANDALDRLYSKSARQMLLQINAITNAPNSQMQRALKRLDDEADRLAEKGERMRANNSELQNALGEYEQSLSTTSRIIQTNDNAIQETGRAVAIYAVTAKVFSSITVNLVQSGVDPLSQQGLNTIRSQVTKAGITWNTPTALDFVTNYVDSPAWISKMEGWGPGYAKLTRDTFVNGIESGWGPKYTAARLRQYAQTIPAHAAENLTRTLQLTSYRDASAAMEVVNGQYIEGKIRIAKLDDRTCLSCIALHGTELAPGERIDDHYRGRCELPGNIISGAPISALVSRRYVGDIIVIRTASGKFLPVTPNHPVLTDRGWIGANLVRKGDNVVGYRSSERASLVVNPNEYHVPTSVENISSVLGMNRLGTVPISAQDFHGDGLKGDVGIVWANRFLKNWNYPALDNHISQNFFGFRNAKLNPFPRFGNFLFMLHRQGLSTNSILSGLDNIALFFFGHLLAPQAVSLYNPANFNIHVEQTGANSTPGNSEIVGDSLFGHPVLIHRNEISRKGIGVKFGSGNLLGLNSLTFGRRSKQPIGLEIISQSLIRSMELTGGLYDICPGQIEFDCIVDIGVRSFSGNVYSLQSEKGWYISNGIISHNCSEFYQVIGGPRFPEQMQADSKPGKRNFVHYQSGSDWFNSLPESRQKAQASFTNSPAKYRAFKDGVKLSEFIGEHDDPVFGRQTPERSLLDILGGEAEKYYTVNQ